MPTSSPSDRTKVRRHAERGAYDQDLIHSILDEGYVCHVGFVDGGHPYVIPTAYGRVGDQIYLHGSAASHMLGVLEEGPEVCVTVTLVDGLVLARAAFRNSMNYRSVVVFGKARLVTDPREKMEALRAFTNHITPGRWEEVRTPTEGEMKATSVLALPLNEASAKVRSGPPLDTDADCELPIWAGVVPIRAEAGEPVPDVRVHQDALPFDTARLARQ
jgi:nitroimidazol reductase NimA-like FMN-containing flavoprotein (pyridoxamine 5'-phosphate oxidase superfamily)